MQNTETVVRGKTRIRKSIPLTPDELKAFRKWYRGFHTKTDAELESGMSMQTMNRIKMFGTCHEHTYAKIKAVLEKFNQSQLNTQAS